MFTQPKARGLHCTCTHNFTAYLWRWTGDDDSVYGVSAVRVGARHVTVLAVHTAVDHPNAHVARCIVGSKETT